MRRAREPVPGTVAAIGTFDGVHRGHRAVLRAARRLPGPVTVLTFDPHPRAVLGERVGLLGDLARREQLLREHGADDVLVLPFDRSLAARAPGEFVESTLRPLGVTRVVGGAGFRFGRARSGDADTLRALGIAVTVVPLEAGASSSGIRGLLAAGEVAAAARALGRDPELAVALDDRRSDGLDDGGPGGLGPAGPGGPVRTLRLADAGLLTPAGGTYAARWRGRELTVGIEPGAPDGPRLWCRGLPASLAADEEEPVLRLALRRRLAPVRDSETALSPG